MKPVNQSYPVPKLQLSQAVYETFHRHIVRKKMEQYNNDIKQYQFKEWPSGLIEEDMPPRSRTEDFPEPEYSDTEIVFIKQYFSIKA